MLPSVLAVEEALQRQERRSGILALEAAIAALPGAVFGDNPRMPLTHRFTPGLYVREIFLPAGTLLTGKIHRDAHPALLLAGTLRILTEHGGMQELTAPQLMIAPPGTKRVGYAMTDVQWVTFHANPTDTQDLAELEAAIIAPDYAALVLPTEAIDTEAPVCPLLG